MVTGKELATEKVDETLLGPTGGDPTGLTGHRAGVPMRRIVKWLGAIKSRVPVGYEDEAGFHYGVDWAG